MKTGSTSNNNAAFGSFRVVMPAAKSEQETFKLLYNGIKKVYPETQIKHDESKRTIGFIRKIIYTIFNITGKSEQAEAKMAEAFTAAKFQVIPAEVTPKDRAKAGFKALISRSSEIAENVEQTKKLNVEA